MLAEDGLDVPLTLPPCVRLAVDVAPDVVAEKRELAIR
jgi:hypothetical protein